MYKFVVDGEWVTNVSSPSVQDSEGNNNNILVVEEREKSSSDGDSDSWEKVSMPEDDNSDKTADKDDETEIISDNVEPVSSTYERMYSMPKNVDYKSVAAQNGGISISEVSVTTSYFDTNDSFLQRKAIWLEKIVEHESEPCWKLSLLDKSGMKIFNNMSKVEEVIQEVFNDFSGFSNIVNSKLVEVYTKKSTVSKWKFGTNHVIFNCEENMSSIQNQVVGDVASAVKISDNLATQFSGVLFCI